MVIKNPWVVVNNTPLRSKDLSLVAKGFLAVLMACDNELTLDDFPDAEIEQVELAVEELIERGWLKEEAEEMLVLVIGEQKTSTVKVTKPKLLNLRDEVLKHRNEHLAEPMYTDEMYKDFLAYWKEPSQTGKQRWQGEKFFDLNRRLDNWFRSPFNKDKSYTPKPPQTQKEAVQPR